MTANAYLDHIVLICAELDSGVRRFEALSGVRASFGGVHASGRTHNALARAGPRCYLEILAPTGPPSPQDDTWCQMAHQATDLRVLTYCLRFPRPLLDLAAVAHARGWQEAAVASNGRTTPEGIALHWQWLAPKVDNFEGVFPFFIDWMDSPHPAETLLHAGGAEALSLREFAVKHPEAARLRALLADIGTPVPVVDADRPGFIVVLDTPKGRVAL